MSALAEFESTVDAIYGVYLDSTTGFDEICRRHERQQQDTLRWLKDTHPELATVQYLDSTSFIYGKGDPRTPEAVELHRCTQAQYRTRNSKGGLNYLFIANMALVAIYQYWEDHFRSEIAAQLGLSKNELKEPVMGDLRRVRHSVVHHAGVALPEIDECEVLKWFHPGDLIYLDAEKFETVIYELKMMIRRLRQQVRDA